MTDEKPWQDEETLRELYHERGMSMQEIADHFGGLTWGGIKYWMDKLDIERRNRSDAAKKRWLKEQPSFTTNMQGYEVCMTDGEEQKLTVLLHRLLAVHKYGFDEVCGMDVHHKVNIPWLNTPSNIELMTHEEHVATHSRGRHDNEPWRDRELLEEMCVKKALPIAEVADELGCSYQTVRRCLKDFGLFEDAREAQGVAAAEAE